MAANDNATLQKPLTFLQKRPWPALVIYHTALWDWMAPGLLEWSHALYMCRLLHHCYRVSETLVSLKWI